MYNTYSTHSELNIPRTFSIIFFYEIRLFRLTSWVVERNPVLSRQLTVYKIKFYTRTNFSIAN